MRLRKSVSFVQEIGEKESTGTSWLACGEGGGGSSKKGESDRCGVNEHAMACVCVCVWIGKCVEKYFTLEPGRKEGDRNAGSV